MNPYFIILIFFTLAGLGMALWGWTIIARGKKTLHWPCVDGVIEQSQSSSDSDDLLPLIVYSYMVSERRYRRNMVFPSGTNPTPAFAASYAKKYPAGAKVSVYYNPEQPDHSTLEPGLARDAWLIFALGITATSLGIAFMLFNG